MYIHKYTSGKNEFINIMKKNISFWEKNLIQKCV